MPDIYKMSMRWPHRRSAVRFVRFYERWSNFFECVGEDWWRVRFDGRHQPSWRYSGVCRCGFDYGCIDSDLEEGWHRHRELAWEQEWDRRWDSR